MSVLSAFDDAAREMAEMLYSDSHIPVLESLPLLEKALREDGAVPNEYEMECLIYGGPLNFAPLDESHPDTDGEGNPDVDARFPATVKAIESLF